MADVNGSICPPGGMTIEEYRKRAKETVDYIVDYLHNIRQRRVFPDVKPGYMQALVPDSAPEQPDTWEDIFADVERVIMPGITHWQSPYMHAYFPALNSYPSLLGDMLANAISSLGFTWASSPACTELETIVMDWLGKMIGLPSCFLHGNKNSKSMGGGCIQTTASDCTFVTLLAARTEAIQRYKVTKPDLDDAEINGLLIGYCSDQAHSSVEKAGLIGLVKMRFLFSDDNLSLRGDVLQEAVKLDREKGLIPFYVCATLGTTGACAFDNLREIGLVCEAERLWLHVDAAYAGSAFICPEYRSWMAGIEFVNSFAFNPSKWLMVHFDCSAMWVKDARALHRTFNVEPLYLQHENSGAAIDYMHWQIALSRRFRSLKLWFVLRCFGVEGLQAHIRKGVILASKFENLVRSDGRFEVAAKRHLGMVVFRLVGANELTEDLLKRLNKQGNVHMVPASLKGKYVIRFTVTSQFTTVEDIERDWKIITDMANIVLTEAVSHSEESIAENDEEYEESDEYENDANQHKEEKREAGIHQDGILMNGTKKIPVYYPLTIPKSSSGKRREYGISLLLSNVPMSPKVVNGSFAALFDGSSADLNQLARQLTVGGEFIRLSPRKRGRLGDCDKQMSLDYSVLSNRKDNPFRMKMMGSLDSKIDDILNYGSKATQTEMDQKKYDGAIWQEDETTDKADKLKGGASGETKKEDCAIEQEHWDTGHSILEAHSKATMKSQSNDQPKEKSQATPTKKGKSGKQKDGQPNRSIMELSKAVCSKVKDVFLNLPGDSSPNSVRTTQNSPDPVALDGEKIVCKNCGHIMNL
ncbi:histidine decarboxylase [Biomphalaria glabrata]|nr:histidine decarboxylase [Biomphalaria glabrata]